MNSLRDFNHSDPGSIHNRSMSRSPRVIGSTGSRSRSHVSGEGRGGIHIQDQNEVQQKNQLTHERVQALKLLTQDKMKPIKIPIEVENKFCSHLDAGTSA